MLGSGYVIDHCISAFQKEQEQKLFNVYITDALQVIADNTMRFNGGSRMSKRFYDVAYAEKPVKEQEETADEIILRMKGKINGRI